MLGVGAGGSISVTRPLAFGRGPGLARAACDPLFVYASVCCCFAVSAGPFKVNGVPLRRLNQAYVIATTTKVDISGVAIPAEASEDSFYTVSKAEKKARKVSWAKREESDFFDEAGKPKVDSVEISAAKKDAQSKLDSQLLALPEFKDKVMRSYMASRFTLTKGQMPHAMTF